MQLDTLDALAFDRTLSRAAEALKALGDTDDLDVRRARAVGVLADPQKALDLLADGRDPGRSAAGAVLWLHLDESALHDIDTFPAPSAARGWVRCPATWSGCGWPTRP